MLKKYEEVIRYLIVGVLTTLVSILSYWLCSKVCHISYMTSTVLSWIVSVLFAFVTNKWFVFQSKSMEWFLIFKELIDFILCRVVTLFIEMGMMWLFVDFISVDDMVSKVIVQVVVIVLNYVFSKLFVFGK